MWHLGKQAVVIALASAKPVPCTVECHAGDDSSFYLRISFLRQQRACRLHDVESPLLEVLSAGIAAQLHFYRTCYAWQVYALAL